MIEALQFSLDYPGINCLQCRDNLKEEIEPVCDGCPVDEWDVLTLKLLKLYDRCCPWGDLDMTLLRE